MAIPTHKEQDAVIFGGDRSTMLVFGTIADTTWRLFVPTIGLTLLGAWADRQWGITPWMMIAGIVLGTVIAVLLVRQQLRVGRGRTR